MLRSFGAFLPQRRTGEGKYILCHKAKRKSIHAVHPLTLALTLIMLFVRCFHQLLVRADFSTGKGLVKW